MKILYITTALNRQDGWAAESYYTVKHAVLTGHHAEVLTLQDAPNEVIEGVTCHRVLSSISDGRLKVLRLLHDAWALKKSVTTAAFDLVHIMVEPLLPIACVVPHKRIIFTINGTYAVVPFQEGFNKRLYQRGLRKIRSIISISEYTTQKMRLQGVCPVPIYTIPLGVDNNFFNQQPAPAGGAKENAFCFVGSVKSRKGLLYAIKAIERLKSYCPDIKLYVIGKEDFNDYAAFCKRYVAENGLGENVLFVGRVSEEVKRAYYGKCLANVLPSVNEKNYFEGFGLIHLEANACGIPSIGSKNCGNESAIKEGVSGFLCEQRDDKALYEKMKYLVSIKETEAYRELCRQARSHAQSNDWQVYMKQVLDVYEHSCASARLEAFRL